MSSQPSRILGIVRVAFSIAALSLGVAGIVACGFGQTTQPSAGSGSAMKAPIDYFQPIPIHDPLTRAPWGADNVQPRDQKNGLEDAAMKSWNYWDGKIIKARDGTYHMFAARWDQSHGHGAWGSSQAIHAVSDTGVNGPYIDKGLCWPDNQGGKGHNVTALEMPDGKYAVIVSETRPGDVFVSDSLDGPWKQLGSITGDNNFRASNVAMMVRPDGNYEMIARSGQIYISKDGIIGPFKSQGTSIYPTAKGLTLKTLEDPAIWFSNGLYHVIVNDWSDRKTFMITSPNGITDWTYRGVICDPTKDFVRYSDGAVNHWAIMERPGVLIEDGQVTHITFASIDVPKNSDRGNDGHGSKILVIPFDGAALDRDIQAADAAKSAATKPAP